MLPGGAAAKVGRRPHDVARAARSAQSPRRYPPCSGRPGLLAIWLFRWRAGMITSVSTLSPYLKKNLLFMGLTPSFSLRPCGGRRYSPSPRRPRPSPGWPGRPPALDAAHAAHEIAVGGGHTALPIGRDAHMPAQAGAAGGRGDGASRLDEDRWIQPPAMASRIDRLVAGNTMQRTPSWTLRPFRTSAALRMSSSRPLVQEPMTTCWMGVPATSSTLRVLEGRWG